MQNIFKNIWIDKCDYKRNGFQITCDEKPTANKDQ